MAEYEENRIDDQIQAGLNECEQMSSRMKKKIEDANSLNALNALRMELVKTKSDVLLKMWQEKYWEFRRCPDCAKRKYT